VNGEMNQIQEFPDDPDMFPEDEWPEEWYEEPEPQRERERERERETT